MTSQFSDDPSGLPSYPVNADPPDPSRTARPRMIPRHRSERIRVIAVGRRRFLVRDMYVRLLAASWQRVILTIILTYLTLNLMFAWAYMAVGDDILNARPGSYADLFFFSIQTFATIGYGNMIPRGLAANVLVTVEAMTGFLFYAMMTGLVFSKFSRPTSRVVFSNVAVICPYNGVPHLMLRLANERGNRIVDARAQMAMLRNETTAEGHRMRRFHDMKLMRSSVPLLQLTWTTLHPIDEHSPLYGMTVEDLKETDAEIIVSLTGLDETFSQTIHARFSYRHDEIVFGAAFEDILHRSNAGMEIHFDRFHDIRMLNDAG